MNKIDLRIACPQDGPLAQRRAHARYEELETEAAGDYLLGLKRRGD